jgi:hypothetical protein
MYAFLHRERSMTHFFLSCLILSLLVEVISCCQMQKRKHQEKASSYVTSTVYRGIEGMDERGAQRPTYILTVQLAIVRDSSHVIISLTVMKITLAETQSHPVLIQWHTRKFQWMNTQNHDISSISEEICSMDQY